MAEYPPPGLVYLSGPMSGIENLNFEAFAAGRQRLRSLGFAVMCPAECSALTMEHPREFHMRRDLQMVMTADYIFVLPGWEDSKGACCEVVVGLEIGLSIIDYETGEDLTEFLRAHFNILRALETYVASP